MTKGMRVRIPFASFMIGSVTVALTAALLGIRTADTFFSSSFAADQVPYNT